MTIKLIEIGNKPNDGMGEALRTAFEKVNENFKEIFDRIYVNDENFPQGSEIYNDNVDYQLTSNSKKIQTVKMTAKNLKVFLPPATSFLTGGPKFEIRNIGSHDFVIRTYEQKQLVTVLKPGESALLFLTDNADDDGVWGLAKLRDLDFYEIYDEQTVFYQSTYQSLYLNAEYYPVTITRLTDTKALLVYYIEALETQGSNYVAQIVEINDEKLNVGPLNVLFPAVSTSYSYKNLKCVRLSDTKVAMTYDESSDSFGRAVILNVTGTTVTNSTPIIYSSVASTQQTDILPLSENKIFLSFKNSSTSNVGILSVSDNTLTLSSSVLSSSLLTSFSSIQDVKKITDTKTIISYKKNADGNIYGAILTTSNSNVITASSPIVLDSSTNFGYTTGNFAVLSTNFDNVENKRILYVFGSSQSNYKHPIFAKILTVSPVTNQITLGTKSENPVYDYIASDDRINLINLDENNSVIAGCTETNYDFPSIPFISFVDTSQSVPIKKAIRSVNQNELSALTSESFSFKLSKMTDNSFLGLNQGFLSDGSFFKLIYYKKPQV